MVNPNEQYELDAEKSLAQLYREWEGCTKCPLGVRREQLDTKMVVGEGHSRSIMLVGEGPGQTEEGVGQPFCGASGYLLREVLRTFNIQDLVYITNLVACRSCQPKLDKNGQPMFDKRGKGTPTIRWEDVPPAKAAVEACWPRFHQELYIVDPIIIVAMGNPAVEALLGHSVSITKDRGKPESIVVKGVGHQPFFTEKRGAWIRSYSKENGFVLPTKPTDVVYTMIPTIHPAFVLRHSTDAAKDSPFNQFTSDLRLAVKVYEQYMLEAHGIVATSDSNAEVGNDPENNEVDPGA